MSEQLHIERIDEILAKLRGLVESGDLESVGLFIPVPKKYTKGFPSLGEEDSSPPHITLLYVGDLSPEDEERVIATVKSEVARGGMRAPEIEMTDYGEFENHKGQIIPHMIPRSDLLVMYHNRLWDAIEKSGVEVKHHKNAFKPHVTLGYQDKGTTYNGPRPTGTWTAPAIEVWGRKKTVIPFETSQR